MRGLEYRRALRAQWLWALALSCIFVALAWAVSAGLTEGFDESIHALLGSSSGFLATPRMQELGRDVTALGGTVVLTFVTLAATGYLLLARRPGAASLVAVSVVGGELLQQALKSYLARPRPVARLMRISTAGAFPAGTPCRRPLSI